MAPGSKPLVIPIFIPHSGCRHRCTYCNQHTVTGSDTAMPTPADVRETIARYLSYQRLRRSHAEVSFYGGNFLGQDPEMIRNMLDTVGMQISASHGQISGIRFSTRPDTVVGDRLDLIAPYPVSTVELGVQSMDAKVLERIKRGHTAEDTIRAVKRLKNTGYRIGCQIMTGLPGENAKSAMATARAVVRLKPDFVRIYPTLVLAGSPLAAEFKRGRFVPLSLDACVSQVKDLFQVFSENHIPVVRMGLQASAELNTDGTVLAGPYHPALGHLVLSAVMLDKAEQRLKAMTDVPETLVLKTHPTSISRVRGLNNQNIHALKNKYPRIRQIHVRPDAGVPVNEVAVD